MDINTVIIGLTFFAVVLCVDWAFTASRRRARQAVKDNIEQIATVRHMVSQREDAALAHVILVGTFRSGAPFVTHRHVALEKKAEGVRLCVKMASTDTWLHCRTPGFCITRVTTLGLTIHSGPAKHVELGETHHGQIVFVTLERETQ